VHQYSDGYWGDNIQNNEAGGRFGELNYNPGGNDFILSDP